MTQRLRILAAALFGVGCGPRLGSADGSADGSTASTSDATTGSSTTDGTTSSVPTTTEDPDSSGSSSGEPLDGPGCGVVPTCDRGELLGSMRIESSSQIDDIAGYTSVSGWLEIAGSDLECLDFLACLTSVGRDLHVSDNAQLRSLDGTDALVMIGADDDEKGAVILAHNDALTEVDGFAVLTRIDSLLLSNNAALERVSGFDGLDVIEDVLSIRFHPNLHDLGPLKDLMAMGDECQVTNNPSLCLSEVYAVCGDLEQGGDVGNTQNDDETCLGDAPPGFLPGEGGYGECSVFDQDCPPGEKCTWWANDGGPSWNATRCVAIDPEAVGPGDSCTVVNSGVSGIDSCDIGSMCWNVDPETNTGECVALCIGNENAPYCPHVDAGCSISSSGLGLCLPTCDPLAQDCNPGEGCYGILDMLVCVPDVSGDLGAVGDPCEYFNVCDPGLACVPAQGVPDCEGFSGCCSPWCDIAAPTCPYPEQECVAFFDPADARWGVENIGVCVIPA
jgi:hypothetical protein